jgi:hypothetical protein
MVLEQVFSEEAVDLHLRQIAEREVLSAEAPEPAGPTT